MKLLYYLALARLTNQFRFKKEYFIAAVAVFTIEVLIALFVRDCFVRPYVGDVLVVILMYCFIRSILTTAVLPTAIFVLIFAFAIEVMQYFRLVELLNLQYSHVARTVIGTWFEWRDLVAYTVGFFIVLAAERYRNKV